MTPFRSEIFSFIAVKQEGSFTRAAEKRGLSQSSVSKDIKKLEETLSTPLFQRGPGFLKLTENGKIYFKSCQEILKSWENTQLSIEQKSFNISGSFKFSTHPVLAEFFLAEFLEKMSALEHLYLEVNFSTSNESVEKVKNMETDFCIAAEATPYPDLIIKPLWKEFVGLFSQNGELQNNLYTNPQMKNLSNHLKKIPHKKYKKHSSIDSYSIIQKILMKNKNSMGILPSPQEKNFHSLKLIKKLRPLVSISLVYRADHPRSLGFQHCLSSLKELFNS